MNGADLSRSGHSRSGQSGSGQSGSEEPSPAPRDPARRPAVRLAVSAGLSALVHVAALLVVGDLWREAAEVQAFRARLELPVRFQPRRLGVTRPQALPAREMEFFRPAAAPAALPDPGLDLAAPTLVDLAQVSLREAAVDTHASVVVLGREQLAMGR